jgi:hypothetical protein
VLGGGAVKQKSEAFVIPAEAMHWQRRGEHGISSNAIFSKLTGFPLTGTFGFGYPHDPDDLRRCRLLLDAVPEFAARLGEMAMCGPEWAELVVVWPVLCETMDAEIEKYDGAKCPMTYRLMRNAIEAGQAKRPKSERSTFIDMGEL